MHAEAAYLFRHALVRDAAYELQPPGEREGLHELAADVMRGVFADALGPVAHEIADHLRAGGRRPGLEREFTRRAAKFAHGNYNHDVAIRLLLRVTEIGETNEVAEAHQLLYGTLRAHRNDLVGARRHALALWRAGRRSGRPAVAAQALNMLAGLESRRRAERLLTRSFRLAASVEGWLAAAIALGNLGALYAQQKDHRRAVRLFRRSISLHRRAQNPVGIGFFLCSVAGQLRHMGDLPGASQAVEQGVAILEEIGAKRYLPTAYGRQAEVLDAQGRFEESERLLAKAEQLATEIQLHREWWKLKIHRALVALERAEPEEALSHWHAVQAWLRENGVAAEIEEVRAELRRASTRLELLPEASWD